MIEIILMLTILLRRIRPLARERGRSTALWMLAAGGAWVGAEAVVLVGYGVIYEVGVVFFGWPGELEGQPLTLLAYVLALLAGLFSADFVRRLLQRLPTLAEAAAPPPPPASFT